MGYTIYWKPTKKLSDSKLKQLNREWMLTYNLELSKLKALGMDTQVYEWNGDEPLTNNEFNFMKTARTPYDYAVKKAFLKIQKLSNNVFEVTCDDGFKYTSEGLIFDGDGYMDEYKVVSPIKLTMSDLPIIYMSKGKGELTNGEYSWNQNKKPKSFVSEKRKLKTLCPYCNKGFNKTSTVFKYNNGEVWHQSCVRKMNKKEGFNKFM